MGKPGAFRSRVIEIGRLAALDAENPRDLPVQEAVNQALASFKPFLANGTAQPAAPQAPKAVIPNLGGSSNAPAKRVVKNMADIMARRKEIGIE